MAFDFDVAMNEAEIRRLRSQISQEISEVDSLLIKVANDCQMQETEDDTILQGIQSIGNKMNELWTETIDAFKKSDSMIDEAFEKAIQLARKTIDAIENIKVNH